MNILFTLKHIGLVLISVFGFSIVFSQDEIKTKSVTIQLKVFTENYKVLKSNKDLRHGDYLLVTTNSNAKCIEGTYNQGEKVGVWNYYDWQSKIHFQVDYEKNSIIYVDENYPMNDTVDGEAKLLERPPLYVKGSGHFLMSLASISYPPLARDNDIQGKVYTRISVDAEGNVVNYEIVKGADKLLNEAAIEHLKTLDLKFHPAIYDGMPGESFIVVPINFRLG